MSQTSITGLGAHKSGGWPQILGGGTKHGECVYYGDVAAKVMGWDITLRRGSSREGQPLIHIGKALRWWDKNTKVYLSVSRLPPPASCDPLPALCRSALRKSGGDGPGSHR